MKNFTPFQLVFIVLFIVMGVFGIMVFAGVVKIGKDNQEVTIKGSVTMWGTVPTAEAKQAFDNFNTRNPDLELKYEYIDADYFNQSLLEALADGRGPDLFLLPDDLVQSYSSRIAAIPYATYSPSTFKSTFASAGEVFTDPRGVLAFPVTIDPLMMYYNRSMLNTVGVVYPPKYWDGILELVPKLTKKEEGISRITQSTVALGQVSNVKNSKDILATMFMQTGNPIVGTVGSSYYSALNEDRTRDAVVSMLGFYTSFSDPLKENYSWNKAMPNSQDAFVAENLAFYFGYASELQTLINKNPNLDLQITEMPQIKGSRFKATKARTMGVAMSAASTKKDIAFAVINEMINSNFIRDFAQDLGAAPATRTLLSAKLQDEFMPIVFASSLYAQSWLDPSPADTTNIFRAMVESILSNSNSPESAIGLAAGRIGLLLN